MMFNLMLFKDRLRVSREALGINQEEFAKKVGIARASASYYENKANRSMPNIEVLYNMAEVLGVSFDYLLGKSDSTKVENIDASKRFGLSDNAIAVLDKLNTRTEIKHNKIFNEILETSTFLAFLVHVNDVSNFDVEALSDEQKSVDQNEAQKMKLEIKKVFGEHSKVFYGTNLYSTEIFSLHQSLDMIIEQIRLNRIFNKKRGESNGDSTKEG